MAAGGVCGVACGEVGVEEENEQPNNRTIEQPNSRTTKWGSGFVPLRGTMPGQGVKVRWEWRRFSRKDAKSAKGGW